MRFLFLLLVTRAAHADDAVDLDAVDPIKKPPVEVEPPEPKPKPDPEEDRRRVIGFGTAIGGGVSAGSNATTNFVNAELVLPTFEARLLFGKSELVAIEASLPVTANVITSAIVGGFAWATDVFVTLNPGTDHVRFIGGLGLGFTAFTADIGSGSAIRVPADIGVELLFSGRNVGLQIGARPWFTFGQSKSNSTPDSFLRVADGNYSGGGVVFVLGFTGYVMTTR